MVYLSLSSKIGYQLLRHTFVKNSTYTPQNLLHKLRCQERQPRRPSLSNYQQNRQRTRSISQRRLSTPEQSCGPSFDVDEEDMGVSIESI